MQASNSDVNLWRIPLLLTLGSVLLFGLTMIPDIMAARGLIELPWWFTMGGIDDARAILSAMLGCVSTVLALIFSVALLVLSMVATLFGPRLLYRFLHDWVTQFTIGLFMATFVYLCLVFLVTHQDDHSTFVPQVSLITSWVLVVISFGFLVYYSHRIAVSIQNPDLVARISEDFRRAFLKQEQNGLGRPQKGEVIDHALAERQSVEGLKVVSAKSGFLQEVYYRQLIAVAKKHSVVIHVLFRPGQFVLRGEALASIWPKAGSERLSQAVLKLVRIGSHRVMIQDPEFGIAQMVEIAIRALSPAINDTFTGLACVDFLADALLVPASVPSPQGCWSDREGRLRLHVPQIGVEHMVKMAFVQIRQAAADNPAVLIRMLGLLSRLRPHMLQEGPRAALRDQADAIWETAKAKIAAKSDLDDIERAWRKS